MKIVVMGGTGLIGSKLVSKLREMGHEVLAVSPDSGVNTFTGEGLPEALAGTSVLVDLTNSPALEETEALRLFRTSTRNLLSAETAAGVRHHVALSVVGTERLLESGYFRAKMTQERLIKSSPVPYTIVRSTQLFELIGRTAEASADDKSVRVAAVSMQPIASGDVASALAEAAIGSPANGTVEVAGPDRFTLDDLVRKALQAAGDTREIILDWGARYFGALLCDETLIPDAPAFIGSMHLQEWAPSFDDGDRCSRQHSMPPGELAGQGSPGPCKGPALAGGTRHGEAPMNATIHGTFKTEIYVTGDGLLAIEQAGNIVVRRSADELVAVTRELQAAYDGRDRRQEPTAG